MKKIYIFVAAIIMLCAGVAFAGTTVNLIIDANKGISLLRKTKKQCESRMKKLNAQMPYVQVVPGVGRQIRNLESLVRDKGGKVNRIDETKLIIDEADNIFEALLLDGANAIQVVEMYNKLLSKYEDPDLQKTVRELRDETMVYWMMFENIVQTSMMAMIQNQAKQGVLPREEQEEEFSPE